MSLQVGTRTTSAPLRSQAAEKPKAKDEGRPSAPEHAPKEIGQAPKDDRIRSDARIRAAHDPTATQLRAGLDQKVDPADPTPAEGDPNDTIRVEGDAFRTDARGNVVPPSYGDVDQGSLGDCWLMTGMAAVAHTDPEYIQDRITENDDGSFNVRIGDRTYRVEPEFPKTGYADPTPGNQADTLWPALIEKAYAQHAGGSYEDLVGGNPGRAMEALTGERSRRFSINDRTNLDTLWGQIQDGINGDHPMAVSMKDEGVAAGLEGNHAYAVIGAFERDGDRYVRLYNPWGVNDGARGLDAVTPEVRLEDLRSSAYRLLINGG